VSERGSRREIGEGEDPNPNKYHTKNLSLIYKSVIVITLVSKKEL
jgi:hypothetical protein